MKKILALVLALTMLFCLASCGGEADTASTPDTVKGEGVMTYAEFTAAAVDAEVTIEAYVQASAFNAEYGNICLYLQDADGGYYVYRMTATADDAAKLVNGAKVKIKGFKAEWSGEVEIAEATYEVLEGNYVAAAKDITDKLGAADLINYMNTKVAFKGLEVVASTDANGAEAPFLYNWDGSGAAGSNNDLYFNVSYNGAVYNFTVESDENAEGSPVYTAVTNLKIGDKIDVEAFLYWYEGANPHVSAVTVAQ